MVCRRVMSSEGPAKGGRAFARVWFVSFPQGRDVLVGASFCGSAPIKQARSPEGSRWCGVRKPACPSPCPVPPLYVAAAFLPHAFCVPLTHPGCFGLAFSRTLRPKRGGHGRGAWKKGCHAALLRAFSHFLATSLDTVFCEAYVHKKRTWLLKIKYRLSNTPDAASAVPLRRGATLCLPQPASWDFTCDGNDPPQDVFHTYGSAGWPVQSA